MYAYLQKYINMKKIKTLSELNKAIQESKKILWYSKIFKCGFEIKSIINILSVDEIECYFSGSESIKKIKLSDIYKK